MCTGFIHKGNDIIYGFNMDLPDGLWEFRVYERPDMFYIGIRGNDKVYRVHGVNGDGSFGCLPYMNAPECGPYQRGRGYRRIDLLNHDYISGGSYGELLACAQTMKIVNLPDCSMHGLYGDAQGRMLLVEPGLGWQELAGRYAVISNFPLLMKPEDLVPERYGWYGVDRYETVRDMLEKADESFGLSEGMEVLKAVRQEKYAPTRVSFVYSVGQRRVRYALEGDFEHTRELELRPLAGK